MCFKIFMNLSDVTRMFRNCAPLFTYRGLYQLSCQRGYSHCYGSVRYKNTQARVYKNKQGIGDELQLVRPADSYTLYPDVWMQGTGKFMANEQVFCSFADDSNGHSLPYCAQISTHALFYFFLSSSF